MHEPQGIAWILFAVGALLGLSVLSSRLAGRSGLPVTLIFLGLGFFAGSEGIGGIAFEDYHFAFRLGTVALVLILFDGGLNTPLDSFRSGLRPAALLATLGVILTAALVAVGARLLGMDWPRALLVGAVVSSTDAAAVFAVLRASGIQLKRRVAATLEIESGLNDPMAVILTTVLAESAAGGGAVDWKLLLLEVPVQMVVGAGLGIALGIGGGFLLRKVRLTVGGLYPILSVSLALLAFAVPTLFHGSGFLAVYLAGILIGNQRGSRVPYRSGLLRVHDAFAWLSQVAMFVLLGLLAFPSRVWQVAPVGVALGLLLALVARPLGVGLLLLPMRFSLREAGYVGWVGLRGAVPIILATVPVMTGVEGGREIFDVVFCIVLVNALLPGATVGWVTRRLGLGAKAMPAPPAVLEIQTGAFEGEVLSFYIEPAAAVCGAAVSDLPFPDNSALLLVARGRELLPPSSEMLLEAGDHIYVSCRSEDVAFLGLLFGRAEE